MEDTVSSAIHAPAGAKQTETLYPAESCVWRESCFVVLSTGHTVYSAVSRPRGAMKRASVVWVSAVIAAVLSMLLLAGTAVVWRSSRAIRTAAEDVRGQHEFSFVIQPAAPVGNPGFEPVSAPQSFLQASQFEGNLYVAGPAGLLEFDSKGTPLRRFTVGSELPASPLAAVAPALLADTREPELLIATSGAGVLAFNGRTIRNILPDQTEVRSVTAILPVSSGHLLFGTRKRGVLIYDGKKISVFHPLLAGIYVTALAGSESDFWVGTLDRGVLHFHAGEVETFAEGQGLPDPQVQSLATSGDTTYIGTANGVAVFTGGRFSRVLAPGVLATALLATPELLYVGSEDQGVIPIPLQGRRPNPNAGQGEELLGVRQLLASGDAVLAVTRDGIYRRSAHAFAWQRVLESGGAVLTDRNISALATDPNGQLWIGYFDRGLDLLSSDNARVRHVEDEHVFCVNRILAETKNGTTRCCHREWTSPLRSEWRRAADSHACRWPDRRPCHGRGELSRRFGSRDTRRTHLS